MGLPHVTTPRPVVSWSVVDPILAKDRLAHVSFEHFEHKVSCERPPLHQVAALGTVTLYPMGPFHVFALSQSEHFSASPLLCRFTNALAIQSTSWHKSNLKTLQTLDTHPSRIKNSQHYKQKNLSHKTSSQISKQRLNLSES